LALGMKAMAQVGPRILKMAERQLNYGLIGCGMMGQEHVRNIALIEGARVAVIYEPDDAMREASRAIAPKAVQLHSLDEMLAYAPLDALVVTSPNHCHAEQLLHIAATRPLPLLMEKPACTSLDMVAKLRELACNYAPPLWTAMEYRYMPPIAALVTEALAAVKTGGTVMLSIREHRYPFLNKVGDWNRFNANTGGTLVEKCCHFFDLMRLIIGRDPIRVYASGGQNHNHLTERYNNAQPDILDNAYVIVDFGRSQRALLELCMFAEGSRYQEEIAIVGPEGKIECRVPGPTRFWPEATLGPPPVAQLIVSPRHPPGPRMLEVPVDPKLLAAGDHNGSTFYLHQRFFNSVKHGDRVEVSLIDGLKAVVIGLAAEESVRTGQAVDLTCGAWVL
jgi:myo-inositol 2-dehydrogenase / D-chiro-inositol 1-dehydrogenase